MITINMTYRANQMHHAPMGSCQFDNIAEAQKHLDIVMIEVNVNGKKERFGRQVIAHLTQEHFPYIKWQINETV